MALLARIAHERSKWVIAGALAFFVVAGVLGAGVSKRLDPFGADDPATESVVADRQLEKAGFRQPSVVVLIRGVDVSSAAGRARVRALERRLAADPQVASTASALDPGGRDLVASDGRATYIAVALRPTGDRPRQDAAERIANSLAGVPGVTVGGRALAERQVNERVEQDLRSAELYAFPLLLALSLLFFRSLVAALLPLLVGGLAIVGTLLVLRVASETTSISIFALNLATGLGLGLAIDYSLFVISRYREEIARGGPGPEATRRTLATAGRTVLFSSLTVAGASASLLVFPQRFLYSMGIAGLFVSLLAAAIALTVLPAVLSLLGTRVNALAPAFLARRAARDARPAQEGAWYRLAHRVMRSPARTAVAAAAVLIALAVPVLAIRFVAADAQLLPPASSARQVDDALRSSFPPHRDTPVVLAVAGGAREAGAVRDAARRLPGVAAVRPARTLADGTREIDVLSRTAPDAAQSQELVREARRLPDTLVTGAAAHYLDQQASLGAHLPLAVVIVALVTFLALFAMTGSVVLPLKQLAMNALSLGAMFGLLVLVFQHGWLAGAIGATAQGGLQAPQLLLLFGVVFGLSTDYGVFLLARIKEARDGGHDDAEAIAVGLERTGRIVTSAALLFAVAFGAFLTSSIVITKQLGLGTAAAVLLDATIVRALLVPALMRLLGRRNWWAPAPLRRLHARLQLGEA